MGRAWILPLLLLFASRVSALSPVTLDHVTVCGSDLDAMRRAFASVGLRADYAGPHVNSGTHAALLGFNDGSYVELIAPDEPNAPLPARAPWPAEIQGDAGPCGWTINVSRIAAEVDAFRRRGLEASTPAPGGRLRPDRVSLEWQTAALAGGADQRLPFLIEDHTPHALRAPVSQSVSSTELSGIAVVVLAVRDLDASVKLFMNAFGWPAPIIQADREFNARVAYFPGTPVMLAAPLDEDSWLADRLRRFGEIPAAFLIGTRDFSASRTRFHVAASAELAGRKLAWFDPTQLRGVRLGVVEVPAGPDH